MTVATDAPAVVVQGATKTFGDRPVLSGLDLTIGQGQFVALLGASGSGKTTLLRVLLGLEPLSAGDVFVPEARTTVFQEPRLVASMKVWRNVVIGQPPAAGTKAAAVAALGEVGLADQANAWPGTLSGGEAQRVALARALATDPRLLLLDEPMAALDVGQRGSVRHELRRHLRGFGGSCVLVTHDPLDAAAIADRLVIVEQGAVVQEGTLRAVTTRPRTGYVAQLAGLNLLSGTADGSRLLLEGGEALETSSPVAGVVLAVIAPRDVALYLDPPHGSPRNTWSTRVAEVNLLGDRARILLDAPIVVTAEITTVSLAELGLTEGAPVWASVKATQIDVYPDEDVGDTS